MSPHRNVEKYQVESQSRKALGRITIFDQFVKIFRIISTYFLTSNFYQSTLLIKHEQKEKFKLIYIKSIIVKCYKTNYHQN